MARIAVLMSGGMDSSAAAWMLHDAGHDVTGITAKMSSVGSKNFDPDDIYCAQRVCHMLGVPHVVVDMTSDFEEHVVGPFTRAYADGLTPNPCAHCNREIKLGKIAGLLVRVGFDRIATGHYAAIRLSGGRQLLCEPADRQKSQVYFLALVRSQILDRLEFPLQKTTKGAVATLVRDLGFRVRQSESQDLCFVASGRYEQLLEARLGATGPGDVLDADGRVVGVHKGHHAYTVGQRFGTRGKRYYVLEKQADANRIVIGERSRALMSRITAVDLNFFLPLKKIRDKDLLVRYRHNAAPVGARITEVDEKRLTVALSEACFAPAPGQVLACYQDDCLVLGGVIASAER